MNKFLYNQNALPHKKEAHFGCFPPTMFHLPLKGFGFGTIYLRTLQVLQNMKHHSERLPAVS